MSDEWEVYALKYAERNERTRSDSFIMDDDHVSPHPMDYFIWLLKNGNQSIVVDTGYDREEAERRDRALIHHPADLLEGLGVSSTGVQTVILTHLHYDHAGDLKSYPNAMLHLQAAEMAYATGPCMCHDHMRMPFTGEHICDAVLALYSGRVDFAEGVREIAPGVETHLVGGHSRGLQAVRVKTRRGWVVLASDTAHYYENFQKQKPFPIVVDMENVLRGYRKLYDLGDSANHIIPGHDPLVRTFYPPLKSEDDSIVVLHADPKSEIA